MGGDCSFGAEFASWNGGMAELGCEDEVASSGAIGISQSSAGGVPSCTGAVLTVGPPPAVELGAVGSVSRLLPAVVVPVPGAASLLVCTVPCTADPFADIVGMVSEVVPPGMVGGVAAVAFVGELSGVGPMIMRDVSISRLGGSLGVALFAPYAEFCSSLAGFC
uniref:Uncharacterized protein n=1 Tax=Anopheles culicifacies TaxID=139723 RepID=A0A182LTA4_9DIPT